MKKSQNYDLLKRFHDGREIFDDESRSVFHQRQ